jgi:tetratricopeptide (TPR) repeat protein
MKADLARAFAEGAAALNADDLGAAERIFQAIVRSDPGAHDAWLALALIALRSGAPDVAVERARRAVDLDRKNPLYLSNLGIAYGEQGNFDAAEQALRRALRLKPADARAHYNLAKTLLKQGKLAESRTEYERAHALEPQTLAMQLGLCRIYRLLGEPARALAVLRAGTRAGPPPSDLVPATAGCIADVEGIDAALAWLREVLVSQPELQRAHHVLADLLLSQGNLREGWPHYLWRSHASAERVRPREPLPARLDGKRVLLRNEQGLGDVLFFLRFAAELRERGATIELECPPRLAPLVAHQVALQQSATFDLQVWLGDLPALLETDATPPAFPLPTDEARCAHAREKLARLGRPPYLGLTWRAGTDTLRGPEFGTDLSLLSKEISPALLGRALRGWPGTLVSLQRAPVPAELEAVRSAAAAPVHDLSAANEDLSEILALLSQLHEYVAVSNTNIHLLAGLGRSARVLVPHPADWRWMRRDGASPWFPGFPTYRQPPSQDWSDALARLRQDLLTSAAARPRAPA